MTIRLIFLLLICLASFRVSAVVDAEGYDEATIRPQHIPKDAPKFDGFPAEIYSGPNAAPDLRTFRRSRTYRTVLTDAAKRKPNFAGHYVIATWGCGTDCTALAIVDVITGYIYHPAGATFNVAVNIHNSLMGGSDVWHESGAIQFRPESRLLILVGSPEEKQQNRGISYYLWDENTLKRIRFVRAPRYSKSR